MLLKQSEDKVIVTVFLAKTGIVQYTLKLNKYENQRKIFKIWNQISEMQISRNKKYGIIFQYKSLLTRSSHPKYFIGKQLKGRLRARLDHLPTE